MTPFAESIQVVGAGRMGSAMVTALRAAGIDSPDAAPRGATAADADVVILAVPDAAIADAAARLAPGRVVGHLSGATELEVLAPHERFSLHPLMTISGTERGGHADSPFRGVHAAVAASSPRARDIAERLSRTLGMLPFSVAEPDRATYHAAASMASNFFVTLEWCAERLAQTAGVSRDALVPLVTASVRNWAQVGPAEALTGPIARGDARTVERQRAAVAERTPELLPLFDALAAQTSVLAASRESGGTK